MSSILGHEGVLCHTDDVFIFGHGQEEHNTRLHSALQKIQTAGVTLHNVNSIGSITFLGHVIDEHGVSTNPGKTQAVREMERPTNITELRRFLSMVNQLGKFSSKLSDLSRTIRSAQSSCTVGPDTGGIIQRHHVRAGILSYLWNINSIHPFQMQITPGHSSSTL